MSAISTERQWEKKSLCEETNIPFHIMHSSIHQSLQSLLAVAPFQPDFSFKSLQKYPEFPSWISKMKTSSECMLTEGPQSLGSLSCFKHHYQKQSSTEAQQYTVHSS